MSIHDRAVYQGRHVSQTLHPVGAGDGPRQRYPNPLFLVELLLPPCAHATHEHSRRQAAKGLYAGIAGAAASIGLSQVKSGIAKDAAGTAASLGLATVGNVYSREYEDQADRVGLRYVYEAGYDYRTAPVLWRRFAQKYGDGSPIENFFFGDHSLSTKRAAALDTEIRNNYSDLSKDPPTHKVGAK